MKRSFDKVTQHYLIPVTTGYMVLLAVGLIYAMDQGLYHISGVFVSLCQWLVISLKSLEAV